MVSNTGKIVRYLKVWGLPPCTGQRMGMDELTVLLESAGFHVNESLLMGHDVKVACIEAEKPF